MKNNSWTSAIDAWATELGRERVSVDPEILAGYEQNVSGWKKAIPVILYPKTTADVQSVVRIAASHGVPVYPISTGCNWGMGSKIPPQEAAIVDLCGLNVIHEINIEHHYAVIGPGVTQGQLFDEIQSRKIPLMINVTGSGRDTSLIGNSLERGVGYFASRATALSGLEVVMPNGSVIETGMDHYSNSEISHVYPYGVGPQLDGLFSQSNMGIVTRAGFSLMPEQELKLAMVASINSDDKLEPLIEALADLQRAEVIRTVTHIGNHHRTEITLSPLVYKTVQKRHPSMNHEQLLHETQRILHGQGFSSWGAVTGLMGNARVVKASMKEIRSALRGLAEVKFMTPAKLAMGKKILDALSFRQRFKDERVFLDAIEPLFGMAMGIPTSAALHSVAWPHERKVYTRPKPDETESGLLYILPMLPCNGLAVAQTIRKITERFEADGFTPYITFNLMEGRCVETVANLAYLKQDTEQEALARACIEELTKEFVEMGYIPYRVGIQSYEALADRSSFWQVAGKIKQSLDPENIIAPGRYECWNTDQEKAV